MPDFMSPMFLLLAGVVVIAFVVAITFLLINSGGSDEGAVEQLQDARAELDTLPPEYFNGQKLGLDSAPLKITTFEDFQCPFCLRYTAEDEPMIVEEFVKTGKVQLIFSNLPIFQGTESLNAARATVCAANQNKFWYLHNELFLTQAEEGQLSNERINAGRFSEDSLRDHASDAGLDLGQYDTCMADPATADEVVAQNRVATSYGFSSTPSFVFNGKVLPGTPTDLDAWRELINEQVNAATASPSPTASASPTASPAATTPAATATTTAAR
ncbi:MAG: thioredoxin domain-containing protein [Dehalococcoidia bacterium]|nr:thioredoxin domain-containing protein [Dehalococcoidia bacterium]